MPIKKTDREIVRTKFGGLCAYTGTPLKDDWQVDHVTPKYLFKDGYIEGNPDDIKNLIPCQKIINHYKRGFDLEGFRKYMTNFHVRLSKLPKKTMVEATKRRIKYMNEIADSFQISVDKPFCGLFYFENIKQNLDSDGENK